MGKEKIDKTFSKAIIIFSLIALGFFIGLVAQSYFGTVELNYDCVMLEVDKMLNNPPTPFNENSTISYANSMYQAYKPISEEMLKSNIKIVIMKCSEN